MHKEPFRPNSNQTKKTDSIRIRKGGGYRGPSFHSTPPTALTLHNPCDPSPFLTLLHYFLLGLLAALVILSSLALSQEASFRPFAPLCALCCREPSRPPHPLRSRPLEDRSPPLLFLLNLAALTAGMHCLAYTAALRPLGSKYTMLVSRAFIALSHDSLTGNRYDLHSALRVSRVPREL